jgi:hypothetical protein
MLFAILTACALVRAQETFRLAVPGDPSLASSAVLAGGELVIADAQGQQFRYTRAPQFDTPDGRLIGFFSPAANQALRWPAAGTGAMFIGGPQGLQWREGLQRIEPVVAGDSPAAGPVIMPAPPRQPTQPRATRGAPLPPGRIDGGHIAIGPDRHGNDLLAIIDGPQSARLFARRESGWEYMNEISGRNLVPGAPLGLAPDVIPGQPRIFTVNDRGELIQFGREQPARRLGPRIDFPAGANLEVVSDPRPHGFAVDVSGRLWHLDLVNGAHEPIDESPGQFLPGAPVKLLARAGPDGVGQEIYVTDSRGTILRYRQSRAGWSPPEPVADGFVPGGAVGVGVLTIPGQGSLLFIAAVDWKGNLQLIDGARAQVLASVMPPGAPVTVAISLDGVTVTGIGVDGTWRAWRLGPMGEWIEEVVARGFAPGTPIVTDPATFDLIATDVRGRIVPAHFQEGSWQCRFCHHSIDGVPRLVGREIVPNDPLPPATIRLVNGGSEELAVQIADAANPAASEEISIPVRGSLEWTFERDAGATIVETVLVPGPLGDLVEHVERYPLPPQPRYSLIVWANRTTYRYIDRRENRPSGALPDFDLKSHVSLGVFDLPPGELLRDGETIDVFRAARENRNPGAAVYFPPPSERRFEPMPQDSQLRP